MVHAIHVSCVSRPVLSHSRSDDMMCTWSGPTERTSEAWARPAPCTGHATHGSTMVTGPLGCRHGAGLGSAPARATHARQGRQAARSIRRGGRLSEATSRQQSKVNQRVYRERNQIYIYSKIQEQQHRKGEADEGAYTRVSGFLG